METQAVKVVLFTETLLTVSKTRLGVLHFKGPCQTVGKLYSQRFYFELNG